MLEFRATLVQVFEDDEAVVVVGFHGENAGEKPRYLELSLFVKRVRGECHFEMKAEVGRPRRVGRDCVTAAELRRDAFHVVFAEGSLGGVGEVRATFDLDAKAYRGLKRGLQEAFCDSPVLRIVPVGRA